MEGVRVSLVAVLYCLMCLLLVPCYKAQKEEVIPHKEISPLNFLGPIDPGECAKLNMKIIYPHS